MTIPILPPPQKEKGALKLVPMSAVKMKPVRWLVHNWFPLGAISVVAGKPDMGKSTRLAKLAADVSNGKAGGYFTEPRAVIYFASEDSWERTIKPRLIAAGADPDMIFRVEAAETPGKSYSLNMVEDKAELVRLIKENSVGLVIFDPLLTIVRTMRTNEEKAVHDEMTALAELFEPLDCACVGIMHFRKEFGNDALAQICGTGVFGRVIRAAEGMMRDPDSENEKRVVASLIKHNLGPPQASYTYTFGQVELMSEDDMPEPIVTSKIVIGSEPQWDIDDLLNNRNTEKAAEKVQEARVWLRAYLTKGDRWISDIMQAGTKAGYSESTVQRAKRAMPEVRKVSVPGTKAMKWHLETG